MSAILNRNLPDDMHGIEGKLRLYSAFQSGEESLANINANESSPTSVAQMLARIENRLNEIKTNIQTITDTDLYKQLNSEKQQSLQDFKNICTNDASPAECLAWMNSMEEDVNLINGLSQEIEQVVAYLLTPGEDVNSPGIAQILATLISTSRYSFTNSYSRRY